MTEYYIPTAASETEFTEKRSRFIGHIKPVKTEDEARAFIEEMKKRYHDARHNCWCYLLREGGILRYSDDGEPQGTAGQPMLSVFQKERVTDLVCVVTRYFGGVLLGAGGLVRAYTRSAKDALDCAGISVVRRWVEMKISCGYAQLERLKLDAQEFSAIITDTEYAADVIFTLLVPEDSVQALSLRLTEHFAGTVTPQTVGESFRAVPL